MGRDPSRLVLKGVHGVAGRKGLAVMPRHIIPEVEREGRSVRLPPLGQVGDEVSHGRFPIEGNDVVVDVGSPDAQEGDGPGGRRVDPAGVAERGKYQRTAAPGVRRRYRRRRRLRRWCGLRRWLVYRYRGGRRLWRRLLHRYWGRRWLRRRLRYRYRGCRRLWRRLFYRYRGWRGLWRSGRSGGGCSSITPACRHDQREDRGHRYYGEQLSSSNHEMHLPQAGFLSGPWDYSRPSHRPRLE